MGEGGGSRWVSNSGTEMLGAGAGEQTKGALWAGAGGGGRLEGP